MRYELQTGRILLYIRYALVIAAGALLALALHKLWSLETRHLIGAAIGIIMISMSSFFVHRFSDFLLVCFFFSIPLTSIVKTLFLTNAGYGPDMIGILLYSGVIGVGLPDILIWGLYASWLVRIFVMRSDPLPRIEKADRFVLLLVAAYVLSIFGTPDKTASVHSLSYLLRFVMVYFYISKNFSSHHIRWLIGSIIFVIFLESALAVVQYSTGKLVGLALDRGAGVRLDQQYAVPGIEHRSRATGTCYESHTFGLYLSMLAQFAFILMAEAFDKARYRRVSSVLLGVALLAVLVSFSRAAWISCGAALAMACFVHIRLWNERKVLKPILAGGLVVLILSPWILSIVIERFVSAEGLLSARFEQFPVAWHIWSDHFVFGFGVGNYMEALKVYNTPGIIPLPVHNVLLWIGAEAGLVGVVAFYGILFSALTRLWGIIRNLDDPNRRLALAIFCSLVAYALDGLTDPLYREPNIYMMFWTLIALSVALVRMADAEEQQKEVQALV